MQTPIHITNIRKNRDKPGLRTQHLVGLEAAANLCGGHLEGGHVGSTEITFQPGPIVHDHVDLSIATAGSVGLVLQVLQISCLQAGGREIKVNVTGGGTYGTGAPSTGFVQYVTYPAFSLMGYRVNVEIEKQGFYPKGGALVRAVFHPPKILRGIHLEDRGAVSQVGGLIVVHESLRRARVAERIVDHIKKQLTGISSKIDVQCQYVHALSVGVGLDMWIDLSSNLRLGTGTILGERGVSSEAVAEEAVREIKTLITSRATVDRHLSDQILPLMAACPEPCEILAPELTLHAKTNIDILRNFHPNVQFTTEPRGSLVKISSKPQ